MKLNLKSYVKTARNVITSNSPVLLVGTAVVGVITTGVLAARGGYKARGIVDAAEAERGEALNFQEKAQLTWLCYAVPAVTGASTLAAVLGVHAIHTKRQAAMAGLYAVTSTRLDDYAEKAEEMMGPKKTQDVNDTVAQKAVDRNPVNEDLIIMTGHGTELFLDELSGRYFYSSMAKIDNSVNEINRRLIDEGDATMNDFYDDNGLDPLDHLGDYGWHSVSDSPNAVEKVSVQYGSALTKNGRAAVTVWFREVPRPKLGRSS